MTSQETVYHYTTGKALRAILQTGQILPSPSFSRATEKSVVWCSVRKDWEPSAACIQTLPDGRVLRRTREEIRYQEGGLIRILLKPEVRMFNWEQYRRISGISPKHLRVLSRFAEECGADIRQWRVSFVPLTSALWAGIEVQNPGDGVWFSHPVQRAMPLAVLLREVRNCLPFMGRQQRHRLSLHLERLGG